MENSRATTERLQARTLLEYLHMFLEGFRLVFPYAGNIFRMHKRADEDIGFRG